METAAQQTPEDLEIQEMLNSLKSEAEAPQAQEEENALANILTPKIIAESIGNITKMIARWAEVKEIAFTEADIEDLSNALKPFENQLDQLLKYLPYLPLVMFAAGYGMRVISGFKEKKKLEKEEKDKKAMEAAARQEKEKEKVGENNGGNTNTSPK